MFLPLLDLFEECLCLLLVAEGQAGDTLLQLKGVEERPVLVI
jgi:hypothetical protein